MTAQLFLVQPHKKKVRSKHNGHKTNVKMTANLRTGLECSSFRPLQCQTVWLASRSCCSSILNAIYTPDKNEDDLIMCWYYWRHKKEPWCIIASVRVVLYCACQITTCYCCCCCWCCWWHLRWISYTIRGRKENVPDVCTLPPSPQEVSAVAWFVECHSKTFFKL